MSAKKRSAFTKLIEDVFEAEHTAIPVATPRFNGGVENFHGRIEDEFYSLEDFTSARDVQERFFGYMLYYNLERPNQREGMNYRTPFEFFRKKTGIDDTNICVFPPLILDKIPIYVPEMLGRSGDFLPDEVRIKSCQCKVNMTPQNHERRQNANKNYHYGHPPVYLGYILRQFCEVSIIDLTKI